MPLMAPGKVAGWRGYWTLGSRFFRARCLLQPPQRRSVPCRLRALSTGAIRRHADFSEALCLRTTACGHSRISEVL